jgi:hypothetical protein
MDVQLGLLAHKNVSYSRLRARKNSNVSVNLCPQNRILTQMKVVPRWDSMKIASDSSKVWKYYGHLHSSENNDILDRDKWYCLPCIDVEKQKLIDGRAGHLSSVHSIGITTSTGNLKVHLAKFHGINVDNEKIAEKQQKLMKSWIGIDAKPAATKYDLNRELVLWFCEDLRPFNIVESGMRHFFQKNFGVDLPDRSTLSKAPLIDVYSSLKVLVENTIKDLSAITLMFDGWTDKYQRMPFFGIRASVVTGWKHKMFTLSCMPVEGHSAKNLSDHIKEVILDFSGKRASQFRVHPVHDGAANMFATSRNLGAVDPQHCLAHSLHLLLTVDGFSKCIAIQNLLGRTKAVVTTLHFKSYALKNELPRKT